MHLIECSVYWIVTIVQFEDTPLRKLMWPHIFCSVFLVTEVSQYFSVFPWGHFYFTAQGLISPIRDRQKNYEKTQGRIQTGYWKKKNWYLWTIDVLILSLIFQERDQNVHQQPKIHWLQGLTAAGRVSGTTCCSALLPWYHLIVTAQCFALLYGFLNLLLAAPQGFSLLHVDASNH